MRTGRSVVDGSGDDDACSAAAVDLVDFRPRLGVVVSTGAGGSTIEVCLRRVLTVGAVCGVVGRLKRRL